MIESRGVRKVVLETTSSNDEDEFAVTISAAGDGAKGKLIGTIGHVSEAEEEEEAVMSPGEEARQSGGEGESSRPRTAVSQTSTGGGGKKKNRRKKRKGVRS